MSAENNGGPAFPQSENWRFGSGMTLRDYFAAHAPAMPKQYAQTARAQAAHIGSSIEGDPRLYASWACAYADAMIAERAK